MTPPASNAPSLFQSAPRIASAFDPNAEVVLHHGDADRFLATLPARSVHLIVSSPPYNIGKSYEARTEIDGYLKTQERVIDQLVRVLAVGGSLCWQVGNYVEAGEVYPLDIHFYPLFKARGLSLRNRVVWHFEHGLHASKRLSGRYETLLWFTKGDEYTFNLDAVRVPAKYPGKTHFKGPNQGKPSGNPLGKNPSDFWQLLSAEWETGVWDIPNVKANHPEKTAHPCQFPVELVERCVLAFSNPGDHVLDPYCGVGSALIAAIKHDRRAVGCDKEAEYIATTAERIAAYYAGTLKLRPLGKPVHKPTGREKVARRPDEWGGA
jgi:DNA modification methylase